jgi:hypothetical protein
MASRGAYPEPLGVPEDRLVREARAFRLNPEMVLEDISESVDPVEISFGCPRVLLVIHISVSQFDAFGIYTANLRRSDVAKLKGAVAVTARMAEWAHICRIPKVSKLVFEELVAIFPELKSPDTSFQGGQGYFSALRWLRASGAAIGFGICRLDGSNN